jgi:universal stress protein E
MKVTNILVIVDPTAAQHPAIAKALCLATKCDAITNTDWHLIRDCPVPLLLTKPSVWPQQAVVAAAIDPGHEYDRPRALDDRILASAHFLATRFGTGLRVFNAVLPLVAMAEDSGSPSDISNAATARAVSEVCSLRRGELERVVAQYRVSSSDLHVRAGVASEELPALARDVGASTAERVLESLPCDVLVIKAPDFAAALPA